MEAPPFEGRAASWARPQGSGRRAMARKAVKRMRFIRKLAKLVRMGSVVPL
jgi:hypothetical protein